MLWLGILCSVLAFSVIALTIKICMLKKSIREICDGFEHSLHTDTNVQVSVSSRDETVITLAKAINIQLSELRRIKRQYENGDQELKDAITNISHDLRTPLTAIWGYLDLLKKKDLHEDEKRYVEQIRNRSEVLKQLTEELFRYSVISSTPEMSYENVDMRRVVEETLISFEGALQEANIIPDVQLPTNPIWRRLDSTALTRIFSNIINNTIKYTDGDFTVILEENGSITFSNTAQELNTVEVGKLFDRFYTVDSARKSTGLGLSIAKLLTERMKGSIKAEYVSDKLNIVVSFPDN